MLEIIPIQEKSRQEEICRACGVEYDADTLAYSAYDGETLVGVAQFRLTDEGGILYDLANAIGNGDRDALFIMGRAVLNFIDLHGVHEAYFRHPGYEDMQMIRKIGFRERDGGCWWVDLNGFFDHPCSHSEQ